MKPIVERLRTANAVLLCAAVLVLSACAGMQATSASPTSPASSTAAVQHVSAGEPSASLRLAGALQKPRTLDLAALKALPASRETQDGRSYTGVDLWALLNADGGLAIPSAPRNAALAYYVVATGSDGYQAVFSLSEIDPAMGERKVLVAYEIDGTPLGRSGMARLVVTGDKKRSRAVANLAALEVRSAR